MPGLWQHLRRRWLNPRQQSTADAARRALAGQERRLVQGTRTIADVIAPAAVEVTRDLLRLEHQVARTLVVTGYPRTVGPGWLAPLVEFDEPIEISLHVHPLDTGTMVRALSHKLVQLHSSRMIDARAGRLPDPEREVAYLDAEQLRDALQRGEERIFSVSLYLLLRATSLEALDDLTRRVENVLDGILGQCRVALFEQDLGFHSALPEGQDHLRVTRNLDTTGLAMAFPFCSSTLSMDTGVLYGIAKHTNSPVLIDPFDPSLDNANLAIIAPSGAGKSYFTKLLALRSLLAGTDFLVIDPEDEYRRVCAAVNGQHIRLASTSAQHMNPFDLPPLPADGDTDADARDPLAEQVLALLELLDVMLATPAAPLSPQERATLERAIYATYLTAGIQPGDTRTYSQPAPLMRDLYDHLARIPGAEALTDRLARYVGSGTLAGLFSSPTNVALDRRFVVFNIQALEPELRPLAIHLITAFTWGQIRRVNLRRPRLFVVDEAWSLFQYPEGGAFLASMARRARKYYFGLITISQRAEDFTSAHGAAVLANSAMQYLMKQNGASIDAVQELFLLTPYERQFLLGAGKGEGLFFARGGHVALAVEASPYEHRLATTAPAELAALADVQHGAAAESSDPAYRPLDRPRRGDRRNGVTRQITASRR